MEPTCLRFREGRSHPDETSETSGWSAGVMAMACMKEEIGRNTGSPIGEEDLQPEAREDRPGRMG